MIREAKRELHLQTYIFDPDETGQQVALELKQAAQRGVKVFLLVDAFGSKKLTKDFIKDLQSAGIKFKAFSPLFSRQGLYFGRRMHQKITVADGEVALIGGINISNKYRGDEKNEPWLDFAVLMEGQVCRDAKTLCANVWGYRYSTKDWFPKRRKISQPEKFVRLLHNDWFRHKSEIFNAYLRSVRQAKSSITVIASYFLPGKRFRKALIKASKRGVKIKLILPGLSDVPLMKYAITWLYDLLFRHNVEIYEWGSSILHAKAMLVDGNWCTIGSFNLINLSAYGSIETNVEIRDVEFVRDFEKRMNELCAGCEEISVEAYKRRKYWLWQFRNWLSYQLIRMSFFVMTFFSYRRIGSRYLTE